MRWFFQNIIVISIKMLTEPNDDPPANMDSAVSMIDIIMIMLKNKNNIQQH